ncbi:MAG: oxidoreductase [Candidatus Cyclobacteriaceae bacterium M3_2C_046]
MSNPIQVGITSYGMSGKIFHAPLISAHSGFQLKKIMQRSADNAHQDYPHVEVVKKLEDIAHDPDIELVVVNTPNPTHFEFIKMMLEAGKHVVAEKPFTNTLEEGQQLIDLAREKGVVLSVFQNRRWDGDFKTVHHVIQQKLLGELVEYEAHYDRFRNYVEKGTWKEEEAPGSGILYNLGSHMIDQVLVLFGLPQAVTADIRSQRAGSKVADNYEVIMDYGNLKATVKSSYMVREQVPRYQLYGREGTFLKYGIDPQEEYLKQGLGPGSSGWGIEPEEDWGLLNTTINDLHYYGHIETLPGTYQDYYENVYQAIRNGQELAVTPEQGLQVIQVIQAAMQSHKEGRRVKLE